MSHEPGARRHRLQGLTAVLIGIAASIGLTAGDESPLKNERPALAENIPVSYRPDGGQIVFPLGRLAPNVLTELNRGLAVELKSVNPAYLSHLPSLGPGSAAKAASSGCLSSRQRITLDGLIIESCNQNKI